MEIAQRVIKEQEEQRKEWERVLESRTKSAYIWTKCK